MKTRFYWLELSFTDVNNSYWCKQSFTDENKVLLVKAKLYW